MVLRAGCARGSFGIAAMPVWCARTCWPRKARQSAGGRCKAPCSPTRRWKRRRWRRRDLRGLRADNCRSTLGSGWSRSEDRKSRHSSWWRRSATRDSFMCVRSGPRGRSIGLPASRVHSRFTTLGGVPEEVLMDNPWALVVRNDAVSRSVQFNDMLIAFTKHWDFRPRACAPYRAHTKRKTESGVGYVKKERNCRSFLLKLGKHSKRIASVKVANVRVHGTTGEAPIIRFAHDEIHRWKPLRGLHSFGSLRELTRVVGNDCAVEFDTNSYSVPPDWRARCRNDRGRRSADRPWIAPGRSAQAIGGAPAADHRLRSSAWSWWLQWRGLPGGDRGGAGAVSIAVVLTPSCRIQSRDRSPLDEAARANLSARETLILLCERKIARRTTAASRWR
ncbi:Transposase [Bradyrhizobium shewense]|uniref:Transposase n=1 Tax=Bradyrhizobium shewense TaxID=1761772 RepID=A0A1C3XUP1_9BRAD|nr:Transposase [Bradyrhizobium shewense]